MSPEEQRQLYQQYLRETQPELYQQYLSEVLQDTAPEAPSAWIPDGPRALDEDNIPWQIARLPLKAGGNLLGLAAAALTGAGEKLTGHDASEIGFPEPSRYLGLADEIFGVPTSEGGKIADSLGQALVPIGQAPTLVGLLRQAAGWAGAEGVSRFLLSDNFKKEHPALSIGAMLGAGLLGGGGVGFLTNRMDDLPGIESSMVKKLLGWDKSGKPLPMGSTKELDVRRAALEAEYARDQGYNTNTLQALTGGEIRRNVGNLAGDFDAGLGLRAQAQQNVDQLGLDFEDFWRGLADTGDRRMTAQRLAAALDDWPHVLREDANVPLEVLAYKDPNFNPAVPLSKYVNVWKRAFAPEVLGGEPRTPQAVDLLKEIESKVLEMEKQLQPYKKYSPATMTEQVINPDPEVALKEAVTDLWRTFGRKDSGGNDIYTGAEVGRIRQAVDAGHDALDPAFARRNAAYQQYMRDVVDPVEVLTKGMTAADTNQQAGLGVFTLLQQGGNSDMDLGKLKPALEYAAAKDPELMQGLLKEHLRNTADRLLLNSKEQLSNPAEDLMKVLGLLDPRGNPETSAARMTSLLAKLSGQPKVVEDLQRLQELAPLVDKAPLVRGIEHVAPGSKEFKASAPLAATGIAPFWIARHGLQYLQGLFEKEALGNVARLVEDPDNLEKLLKLAKHDTRLLHDPMVRRALGQGLLGAAMAEKH